MKKIANFTHRERGFSLVELMVAITIGLIIMAAVGSIFVNANRAYNTQDRLARTQENGRFALYYVMRDLRMAGYFGCISGIATDRISSTLNDPSAFSYNFSVPLEGVDNDGGNSWWPTTAAAVPAHLADTDVLAIRLVDPSSQVGISEPMPNSSAELKVSSVAGLADKDIILLSDCATADVMQLTAVQPASSHLQHNAGGGNVPGNITQKLQKAYDDKAKVFKFVTRRYYIANKQYTDANGNITNIPSLYRDENGKDSAGVPGQADELVEGIENMQILYGIDTDGDRQPNYYLKAGQPGLQSQNEWANVVSVQIGFLSRTLNAKDVDIDTNSYKLPGKTVTFATADNDRNMRRVFQATVLLRNMTIQ